MLLLFAYGVILFLIITRGWTTNVPKHIRAPRAVTCDIFLLRVSALMGTLAPFYVIGNSKEFPIT